MGIPVQNPLLPARGNDDWGSGAFLSSRSPKFHEGRDYRIDVGEPCFSPIEGKVLRIGYPYKNEHFRLVEIRSMDFKALFRLFYVSPVVKVGEIVEKGGLIGYAQDISSKYRDPNKDRMVNHIHIEVILDPDLVFDRQEI